jgi:mannose-1-phosphate guanylyltransferase
MPQAIILVGGAGTRLQPLTNDVPKPMVPVLNRPFLEHTIAYLRRFGIEDIILTLSYLPEVIQQRFGDGLKFGIRLTYVLETRPLGTAGAVKNAQAHLNGTFVVLNGDVFTDLDIGDMLAFHRANKAQASIALTRVDNPCAFGVVETDDDARIRRFTEKPCPEEVITDWINAGIYILEPDVLQQVPQGRHYMFENGLFPALLEQGQPVYGYHYDGQWLDMGTPDKYLGLNCDLLLAKIDSALIDGMSGDGISLAEDASVHPSARIAGPVVIAGGCRIGRNVHIKGPVVIGPDCVIGDGASLEAVVLWRGVDVGADAILRQCVVGNHARVSANGRVINCVEIAPPANPA